MSDNRPYFDKAPEIDAPLITDGHRAAARELSEAMKIIVDTQIEAMFRGFRPIVDRPFWPIERSLRLGRHLRKAGEYLEQQS